MFKRLAIGVAVLMVVLAIGAQFLWSNLDRFVKAGIEKYGTAATQTDVRVSSVHLTPAAGEGKLSGFTVGNPKGFSSAKSVSFGSVSLKIDPSSVTSSGPIVISEVAIEKPQVNYEMTNAGESNLQTIQRNAHAYVNAMTKAGSVKKPAEVKTPEGTTERKVVINDLVIHGGQVSITQPMLQQGKPLTAELPTIHLTGIGKKSNGATAAEVADQLLGSISQAAAKVAATNIAKAKLGGALKGVGGGALGSAIGDAAAGVTGGSSSDSGSGLNSLFDH